MIMPDSTPNLNPISTFVYITLLFITSSTNPIPISSFGINSMKLCRYISGRVDTERILWESGRNFPDSELNVFKEWIKYTLECFLLVKRNFQENFVLASCLYKGVRSIPSAFKHSVCRT